jgi:hypothetical protein
MDKGFAVFSGIHSDVDPVGLILFHLFQAWTFYDEFPEVAESFFQAHLSFVPFKFRPQYSDHS